VLSWGCGDGDDGGNGGGSETPLCSDGFQDRDDDGVCEPTCSTWTTDCGSNGVCDDADGSPTCECGDGYAGTTCDTCAEGFQDDDGDGVCEPNCQSVGLDCGDNGACDTSRGSAVCACSDGYTGDACDTCADGYQDDDADGVCESSCELAGLDCGDNGTCTTASGAPSCECATGYAGNTCDICAEGYLGDTGTCEPDCTMTSLSCANGVCADDGGVAECVCESTWTGQECAACVTGYTLEGDTCVWTGGPADGVFQTTSTWTAERGAAVNAAGDGRVSAGEGEFSSDSRCDGPTIGQAFDMPQYSESEALIARFNVKHVSGAFESGLLWFGTGGGWTMAKNLENLWSWQTVEMCLGERAYGAGTEINFSAGAPRYCDSSAGDVYLDDVEYVVDTEGICPAPGEAINGDFEAGATGWELRQSYSSAEIQLSQRANEGYELVLTADQRCSNASAEGTASAPWSDHTALQFDYLGTAGAEVTVSTDDQQIATIEGTGGWTQRRVCVPTFQRGMAFKPKFSIRSSAGSGNCTDSVGPWKAHIDNVTFVDDPSCGDTNGFIDGGFEDADTGAALWYLREDYDAEAEIVHDASSAHNGFGAMRLHAAENCAGTSASIPLELPQPAGTNGTAISFWYRTTENGNGNASASMNFGYLNEQLPASSAWRKHTFCVPTATTWVPSKFTMRLNYSMMGTCGQALPPTEWWIDDIEVTTDASCTP
jgi:hypothetical protein